MSHSLSTSQRALNTNETEGRIPSDEHEIHTPAARRLTEEERRKAAMIDRANGTGASSRHMV